MITPHFLSIIVAIAHLSQPSTAQWQTGKGAQVNFYKDGLCSQFQKSATAWWDRSPRVADNAPYSDEPDCLSLNPPGDASSANVAAMWKHDSSTSSSGFCMFFDGYGCTGTMRTGYYLYGSGECLPARSANGNYLWKSAQCWVDY